MDNGYTYDVNGNMTKDLNKGITNISYNHLNLPTRVTIGGKNIDYTYDAGGVKLSKTVSGVATQYAGNYVYENGVLQFFNHPEGYVSPKNASDISQGFKYVYQYKDHLGNVRLSYTDNNNDGVITPSTEIIEESNYYPFGLLHKGYNNVVSSNGNSTAEKFKYQGQELEEELGKNTYAYQWRDYDPAIARFNKIDRFAEKYMKNSPYSFTANNPIYFREIAGDSIDVSRALAQDRKALTKVVKDLQTKTGLTFTLKKGKLVYKKDADGNAIVSKDADGNSIGSESARNLVTGALDNSKTVNLSFGKLENGNVGVAGTSSVDGMEHIVLDPSNIDKMISGSSKGLNNTTFGFAMSFMHEIDHTSIGVSKTGHGAESTTFGLTGTVVDNMNKIRRELGSSYGQRTSYSALKTYSGNFIPFSTSSLSTLKSNPTPGILSILSNGNSKALNKIYKSIKF
ncbi:RHS repeat domain-containing protein [Tenacibaculum maritimum]|uniref:RHS repeat domain-containing protein n=2 Tax=Tenacibaculum maritimum TaxID=107401 RepID=UPI0013310B5D|nr:RHS repeat-associated core domain-containing protein [Tenacibaculum maritimum]